MASNFAEAKPPVKPLVGPGLFLSELDVTIKTSKESFSTTARFFYNHQRTGDVWLELPGFDFPAPHAGTEVDVIPAQRLQPFKAQTGRPIIKGSADTIQLVMPLFPLPSPLEFLPSQGIKWLGFGLLNCPFPKSQSPSPQADKIEPMVIQFCGFVARISEVDELWGAINEQLGPVPNKVTHSVFLERADSECFDSSVADSALRTLQRTLSFAAGRWVGLSLVASSSVQEWGKWGCTQASPPITTPSWFDGESSSWLSTLADCFHRVPRREGHENELDKALGWFLRSNLRGAGIDGSVILAQCALELLSYLVVVRSFQALSDDGFGRLSSADERIRLMLSLLDIPAPLPESLTALGSRENLRDAPAAIVFARNYLVHPTKRKGGGQRVKVDLPWFELWQTAQRLVELTILRCIGYQFQYLDRLERLTGGTAKGVPWVETKLYDPMTEQWDDSWWDYE